jgi:hypothetical protein
VLSFTSTISLSVISWVRESEVAVLSAIRGLRAELYICDFPERLECVPESRRRRRPAAARGAVASQQRAAASQHTWMRFAQRD